MEHRLIDSLMHVLDTPYICTRFEHLYEETRDFIPQEYLISGKFITQNKQTMLLNEVDNLFDMMVFTRAASVEDLVKVIKYSYVVLDAIKYGPLDIDAARKEFEIDDLIKKYNTR